MAPKLLMHRRIVKPKSVKRELMTPNYQEWRRDVLDSLFEELMVSEMWSSVRESPETQHYLKGLLEVAVNEGLKPYESQLFFFFGSQDEPDARAFAKLVFNEIEAGWLRAREATPVISEFEENQNTPVAKGLSKKVFDTLNGIYEQIRRRRDETEIELKDDDLGPTD